LTGKKVTSSNGTRARWRARSGGVAAVAAPAPQTITPERQNYLMQMRVKIHQKLVERLNVQNLRSMPINVVRQEVRTLIANFYNSEKGLLSSRAGQAHGRRDGRDLRLGPSKGCLKDPTIHRYSRQSVSTACTSSVAGS